MSRHRPVIRCALPLVVVAALVAAPAPAQTELGPEPGGCGPDPPLSWPLRAAFYYPWWGDKWDDMENPASGILEPRFRPDFDGDGVGELYSGDSDVVVDRQIAAMQWGHIAAGISSWWGIGKVEDVRLARLLARGRLAGFKWCIYYEQEARGDPPAARIAADLVYLYDSYALHPAYADAYLRVCGRPVVFVYDPRGDCEVIGRWHDAADAVERLRGVRPYVVLHEMRGFESCPGAAEFSWHRYCPARGQGAYRSADWSFVVRPGFSSAQAPAMQPRSLAAWERNVTAMAGSGVPWELVTSFNEWLEGTAVEPAVEWASPSGFGAFLDVLHRHP